MTKNNFVYPDTIEIGGLSKEDLIQKIKSNIKKDSGHYDALCIVDTAEAIVMNNDFTMLPQKKMVKLIYRTVADMGFTDNRTKLSAVRDFIKANYKDEFCENETALWLRLVWDRVTFDWVYITTKFHSIDGGVFNNTTLEPDNPYLFHFCGNFLYNEELNPNFECELDTVFIFQEKDAEEEYLPEDDLYAEKMDEKLSPHISVDDMMLKVNQHYGPPSNEG